MVVENQASGQNTPGSTDQKQTSVKPDERVINAADHDRAVQDMLKYKSGMRESNDKITQLESTIEEMKAANLKERDDYKSLYETEVDNHNTTKSRAQNLQDSFYTTQKHSSIYPALKKAGLRDDAEKILESISYDSLEVETTSEGRVFVNGVETFVEKFKADYPFAFEQRSAPTVNSAGGNSGNLTPTKITPAYVIEVEKKHGRNSEQFAKVMNAYMAQKKSQG